MIRDPHSVVQRSVGKKYASYVLITCENPSAEGQMQVEMTYHGDPALASFLLEEAQDKLGREEECLEDECDAPLITHR